MAFLRYLKPVAVALFAVICFTSCVKDIDLEQAGDIVFRPDMQVDILIFTLEPNKFIDTITGQQKMVVRDTVRLEFLDDSYVQNDLQSVEFSFRYRNTFTQAFHSKISFLSENDRPQHVIDFYVGAGSKGNPAYTEKVDLISPNNIFKIRNSIKMVVEVEVLPNLNPFEGELNFASKGLFSFEFR